MAVSFKKIRSSLGGGSGEGRRGIYFGGTWLPAKAATSHFMVVGSTGSGKTLTLRMLMGSALPDILTMPDQRGLVFDVKQDALSILYGILEKTLREHGVTDEERIAQEIARRVVVLNPFDRRCHAWDIARDIKSPETALQLATILVPEEQGQNRYFSDAARDLLTGVLNVFIERAGDWTFADLLFAMRSADRILHVLSHSEDGSELAALHLQGGNTTRSVISTARSKLAPYEVVGALWSHAAGRISLTEYLGGNVILVLGNNQAALAPIRAINRVLFQRLTELILDQSESETRRTWFFLDEVRKLGRLDGLDDLMTNGRSKGAAVVLGFQDIGGMRAVYGKEIAEEITAMCASYGVLRVAGDATPAWASAIFGEQEVVQMVRGRSDTHGLTAERRSSSSSYTEQIRERRLYLPSEFRILPRPQAGKPLYGYFSSIFKENGSPYKAEIPSREVDERLFPLAGGEVNFVPWPEGTSKKLPAWRSDDYERLHLMEPAPAEEAPEAPAEGVGPAIDGMVDPYADETRLPTFDTVY